MENHDEDGKTHHNIAEEQKALGCKSSQNSKPFTFHLEVYEAEGDDGDTSVIEDRAVSGVEIETESDNNESSDHKKKKNKRKRSATAASKLEKKVKLDESMQEVLLSKIDEEIERQLDSKASKSNLTIANVKHILKQVITNEHVVAMVRHTVNENDSFNGDDLDELPGPKLTRSKTKELLASQPEMAWPMTPAKRAGVSSECQALIEHDLPEDSSDEEYRPNEEDLTSVGDWEFMSEPATPGAASTPRPPSNLDCSTQTSWTEDGAFRIPAENIGQRTRSKLSLSDTALETIEKAFVPPDITTDMYEFDCDDDDWKEFLNKFTEPLKQNTNETIDDDEETDPEYNLLADEEKENVDKEELRRDRGVKVSKKELNQLVAGLFDMYDEDEPEPSTSRVPREVPEDEAGAYCEVPQVETSVKLVQTSTVEVRPDEGVLLTMEQRELLAQQMRKHVQLAAQHFVQTFGHPILSNLAEQCKEQLEIIKSLSNQQDHSMFNAVNLDEALQLVNNWEEIMDEGSDEACRINEFITTEINTALNYRKVRKRYMCKFPTELLDLVSESRAILYPLLLPSFPFRCDGEYSVRISRPEINLLAIGLEQFMPYVKEHKSRFGKRWNLVDCIALINEYLLPGYDVSYLRGFIKKERKTKYTDKINPIRIYFDTGKAPGTDHYVIALGNADLRPLRCQPPELLPSVWREHVFPEHKTTEFIISAKEESIIPAFHFVSV